MHETPPELELALRERDRIAYRIRSVLKPFDIRAAYLNPKSGCVELHLRTLAPSAFYQALSNFLTAHGFLVAPLGQNLVSTKTVSEGSLQCCVRVTYVSAPTDDRRQIIRIEGIQNVA